MDQSMWQTFGTFLLHSSHMWLQTIFSCGKHCQAMQIGTVSRLRFCRRSWGFKITSGGKLCIIGSRTFVPISWMCKKQTSVSYSSTESEIISLDTGFRLDGKPALDLWDLIVNKYRETSLHLQRGSQFLGSLMIWIVLIYSLKGHFFSSGSFVVCVWG